MAALNNNNGSSVPPPNGVNLSQDVGSIKTNGFSITAPNSQGGGKGPRRRYANVVSETRNVESDGMSAKKVMDNVYSSGKQSEMNTGDKKL